MAITLVEWAILSDPIHLLPNSMFRVTFSTTSATPMLITTILAPVTWIEEPNDVRTSGESNQVVKCSAKGKPDPKISWRKILSGSFLPTFDLIFVSFVSIFVQMARRSLYQRMENWKWVSWGRKTMLNTNVRPRTELEQVWSSGFLSLSLVAFDTFEHSALFPFLWGLFCPKWGARDQFEVCLGVRQWLKQSWIEFCCCIWLRSLLVKRRQMVSSWTFTMTMSTNNVFTATPKIRPFSFPSRVSIGSTTTLTCSASGSQPFTFKWFKDGQELGQQASLVISQSVLSSAIDFTKIQEPNEGNYTCRVTNSFGSDSFTARLEIEGNLSSFLLSWSINYVITAPVSWIEEPNDAKVSEGADRVMVCSAKGSPKPKVFWTKIAPGEFSLTISVHVLTAVY